MRGEEKEIKRQNYEVQKRMMIRSDVKMEKMMKERGDLNGNEE